MHATGMQTLVRSVLRISVSLWCLTVPLHAKTVWDGVFTAMQAERGQASYTEYCLRCHKADLQGIEGAMKG